MIRGLRWKSSLRPSKRCASWRPMHLLMQGLFIHWQRILRNAENSSAPQIKLKQLLTRCWSIDWRSSRCHKEESCALSVGTLACPFQRGSVAAFKHIPRRDSLNTHIPTNTESQNVKTSITNCIQEFRIWCKKTISNLCWTADADGICMVEADMVQHNNSSLTSLTITHNYTIL